LLKYAVSLRGLSVEYTTVPVSQILVGMVVARPIVNSYGQTLLSTDTTIEEQHLKLFKIWGIDSVSIHQRNEEQDPAMQELTPHLLEQGLRRLRRHVQWNPRTPVEHNLFRTAVKVLAHAIIAEEQREHSR
jgi:hypothetical protein